MGKGWFENFNGWKFGFLVIVVMIVTRIVAPDVAAWILTPIVNAINAGFATLGG